MIHRAVTEAPLVLTADMIVPADVPNAADLLRASAAEVAAAAGGAILLLTGEAGAPPAAADPVPAFTDDMVRAAADSLPAALRRNLLAPVVLPATAPKLRPIRGFSLALMLHMVVLAGLFGFFYLHRKPPPPPQMIEISMALESTAPTGAAARPARPVTRPPLPVPVVQKPAPISPPAPPAPAVPRPAILPVAVPYTAPAPPRPVAPTPPAPALPPGAPLPPHPASAMDVATIPAHPDPFGQTPPDYPRASRERGEEGEVLLSIRVLADGVPETVLVAQSSGYPALDDAARDAVLRWHFAPALRGGVPVDFTLTYRILFQLQ